MKPFKKMTIPEIKTVLTNLAREVRRRTPAGTLFVVLLFDNDTQIGRFTSNANRRDVIAAMREYADVLEKMEESPT